MTATNTLILSSDNVKLGDLVEPGAKRCIDGIAAGNADLMLMQIVGFQTVEEALLLQHLLWYAYDKGVDVRFVPKEKKAEGKDRG